MSAAIRAVEKVASDSIDIIAVELVIDERVESSTEEAMVGPQHEMETRPRRCTFRCAETCTARPRR